MSGMEHSRAKLLYLIELLREQSDEERGVSMTEILSYLNNRGAKAERKSVYRDLMLLKEYGFDIEKNNRKPVEYCLLSRDFDIAELKLLVDAVQSARFISESMTDKLIRKLEQLTSRRMAGKLHRQVHFAGRVKTGNEHVHYTTATLHEAIHAGMRVRFKYVDYDLSKGICQRRQGSMYEMSPYAMVWNDDNYNVLGYYERHGSVSVFRVDRMKSVEMTEAKSVVLPPEFNLVEYIETKFGMFSGEQVSLDIRFTNDLINPVMDRFGMKTPILIDGDRHFIAHVRASVSPVFYSWLFQFGDRAQILKPERIAEDYISQLSGALAKMNGSETM